MKEETRRRVAFLQEGMESSRKVSHSETQDLSFSPEASPIFLERKETISSSEREEGTSFLKEEMHASHPFTSLSKAEKTAFPSLQERKGGKVQSGERKCSLFSSSKRKVALSLEADHLSFSEQTLFLCMLR